MGKIQGFHRAEQEDAPSRKPEDYRDSWVILFGKDGHTYAGYLSQVGPQNVVLNPFQGADFSDGYKKVGMVSDDHGRLFARSEISNYQATTKASIEGHCIYLNRKEAQKDPLADEAQKREAARTLDIQIVRG